MYVILFMKYYTWNYGDFMGLSEKAKENKKAYKLKYAKNHYKRVPLDLTFDKYDEIKHAAEKSGESVNGYIKVAIDQRLNKEK